MDKYNFNLFEQSKKEIKTILLNDATIRKLLYYDSFDALQKEDVDIELVKDHIVLKPTFGRGIEENDNNVQINIVFPIVSFDEETNNCIVDIDINVMVATDCFYLQQDNSRLWIIVGKIFNLLNNTKLETSISIKLSIAEDFIFSDGKIYGYRVKGTIKQGANNF